MVQTIIMALIAGAIVGPLARLALPGRQSMSAVTTVLIGALGALAGAWIFHAVTGKSDTTGIDWVAGLIGVVVAAALVVVYGMVTGPKNRV